MGILGFSFFLIFTSLSASADEYQRFKDLPTATRNEWAKQASATTPLRASSALNCSAVFVGPNGEALTNLHCLEECLIKNGVAKTEPIAGTKLQKWKIDSMKLPSTCAAKFDTIAPIIEKQIEVLHVFGPGWVNDREEFNNLIHELPEKYFELTSEGFEAAGDMVLIRLPVSNNSCVSLGDADFLSPKPVDLISLSYPIVFRKNGNSYGGYGDSTLFTLGLSLLWSAGQASANDTTLIQNLLPEYIPNVDIITPKGLIISDTDGEGGASGSGLYDKSGKLVALTRSSWKGLTSQYVSWTSGAIDLAPHKAAILQLVPKIEKCD